MNYDQIKELAKESGQRVSDLLALAPQNDPFYAGTPGDYLWGEWFAALWNRFGYSTGVHLRRIHYRIISQNTPVTMPNGLPYENTEKCWDKLGTASKAARYLRLVDPASFDDRRNPDPVSYAAEPPSPDLYVNSGLWGARPDFPGFPQAPNYMLLDYRGDQMYDLHVWCEKSSMDDILKPLCQQYGATLQVGVGELSITRVLRLVEGIEARGKPARIFYVSDFDPAGKSMPVAVSRKIEYFIYDLGLGLDVRLFPVVLSEDQVRQYRLPRTPIKETERRRDGFENRFGMGAVELDALEAIYPGELARVLRQEMSRFYDAELAERVRQARRDLEDELQAQREQVIEPYQPRIDALQQEYDTWRESIQQKLDDYNQRLESLWSEIEQDLEDEQPGLGNYPIPEAEEADEDDDTPLFDSQRDYFNQIAYYKDFQGR